MNKNKCDCCMKSWIESTNSLNLCKCWCYKCDRLLRECKYSCYDVKPKLKLKLKTSGNNS